MSIELIATVNGKNSTIEEAINSSEKVKIGIIGSPIWFEKEKFHKIDVAKGTNLYTIWARYKSFIIVTGRTLHQYQRDMARYGYKQDIASMIDENLDSPWFEAGPGLGELSPTRAKKQKEAGGPKLTIAEPLDYNVLKVALQKLSNLDPNMKLALSSNPFDDVDTIIRRIDILTNPEYVTWLNFQFNSIPREEMEKLQGKFSVVMDYGGANFYEKRTTDYLHLVCKGGHIIVI